MIKGEFDKELSNLTPPQHGLRHHLVFSRTSGTLGKPSRVFYLRRGLLKTLPDNELVNESFRYKEVEVGGRRLKWPYVTSSSPVGICISLIWFCISLLSKISISLI